jgi:hypothetical protein
MNIHCPLCGAQLTSTDYHGKSYAIGGGKGENFAFKCDCSTMLIFARRFDGALRAVYFIPEAKFDAVWESNKG